MHIWKILVFLFAVHTHRSAVVAAYAFLLLESGVNSVLPALLAKATDGIVAGNAWWAGGVVGGYGVLAMLTWCRIRADTKGFDGSVTEAVIEYARTTKDDHGEIVNNIKLSSDIAICTKYVLPGVTSAAAFAAGALVYLATVSIWLLLAALAYLSVMGLAVRKMASVSDRIAKAQHTAQDSIKSDVESGRVEGTLRKVLSLEIAWSNAEALLTSARILLMGILVGCTVLLAARSGQSMGTVVAVLAYLRAVESLVSNAGTAAAVAAKAADVCRRLAK